MSTLSTQELNSGERMLINVLVKLLQARETKYKGMTRLLSPEKIENRRRRKVTVGFGKR